MITEKGSVKTAAAVNGELQKELTKATYILSLVYIVLGAVVLVLGILLYVIGEDGEDSALAYFLLIAGVFFLLLGIVMLIMRNRQIKDTAKVVKVEENEFFQDYLITKEYVDGEHLSTAKVYYSRLVMLRETKNYIFLYNTRVTALSVDKRTITPDEAAVVRSLANEGIRKAALKTQSAVLCAPVPEVQNAVPGEGAHKEQAVTAEEQAVEAECAEEQSTEGQAPSATDGGDGQGEN